MRAFWLALAWIICGTWAAYPMDWPNWRGPDHNGISQEAIPSTLPEKLPVRWTAQVGTGFCTVSVQGEKVLTMGNCDDQDTVWCLDGGDLEPVWKTGRDVNAADPLVRGDHILVSSAAGTALLEVNPGEEQPREVWRQRDMKCYYPRCLLPVEESDGGRETSHKFLPSSHFGFRSACLPLP